MKTPFAAVALLCAVLTFLACQAGSSQDQATLPLKIVHWQLYLSEKGVLAFTDGKSAETVEFSSRPDEGGADLRRIVREAFNEPGRDNQLVVLTLSHADITAKQFNDYMWLLASLSRIDNDGPKAQHRSDRLLVVRTNSDIPTRASVRNADAVSGQAPPESFLKLIPE